MSKLPVIAIGGGGIPVIRLPDGTLEGRDAVIDKDHASSLLATQLAAARKYENTKRVKLNFRAS